VEPKRAGSLADPLQIVRKNAQGLVIDANMTNQDAWCEASWPVCAAGAARPRVASVSPFFQPPSRPSLEFADGGEPPPWTGRPQGPPLGAAVSELLLGRSEQAAVYLAYIDAYPEGLELEITATASVAYRELRREGDDSGPDVFGRHWPMVGERNDAIPPQILRIGVEFADGRTATNVSGHDRPLGGPVMWALKGGGSGRGGESSFHQGYWISPLPPPGPVGLVCEWPALAISLVRREVNGQSILDAARQTS
jgi:hypothetical protein